MITRVFWDIDETLLHTQVGYPSGIEGEVEHSFSDCPDLPHYTVFRPGAKELVKFSQDLVGISNVFILTDSIREYAESCNRLGNFGVPTDQIIPREEINAHQQSGAYGQKYMLQHAALASENAVLIDNLRYGHNIRKVQLMNISDENYFWVYPEFHGYEYDMEFCDKVKQFLTDRHV